MPSKPWIRGLVASAAIWGTGAAGGVVVAAQTIEALVAAEGPNQRLERVVDARTPEAPSIRLCVGIFGRNLAVYLWLLCGLITGGLTTAALLAFNGVALGQIAGFALGAGVPVERLALLTLPHAVPELGAFLVAAAVGLRGPALLSAWFNGTSGRALLAGVWRPAAWGVLVIAVAAAIEVFVTVPIARAGVAQ